MVSELASTCTYTRLSCGILSSPLAVFFNVAVAAKDAAALCFALDCGMLGALGRAAFFDAPHARSLSSAAKPFSFCVGAPFLPVPSGVRFEQSCSYVKRCFRQYDLRHLSQCTPVTRGVLMRVLQLASEHCCSCVSMLGREAKGVFVLGVGPRFASARFRAHSPALGHECAVSVLWSPQNFLMTS